MRPVFAPLFIFPFILVSCAGLAWSQDKPSGFQPPLRFARAGEIDVYLKDVVDRVLDGRVVIQDRDGNTNRTFEIEQGRLRVEHAAGTFVAYVYANDDGVPYLVDVREVTIREGSVSRVDTTVLEGAGIRPLSAFDWDSDQAIDRVEIEAGTNPRDAGSIPGVQRFSWPGPVLSTEAGWYRGELQAHSSYGRGTESVAELVRRAERSNLDFLAITDRNTLQAAFDPDFKSESVVLLPAMEWGTDEHGVALIYAPLTYPSVPQTDAVAQALALRVQAQGGIFAVAFPCLPESPWQWDVKVPNAIQVWCRDWRRLPPVDPSRLQPAVLQRNEDGRLIRSIARSASTQGISANGQASLFYDLEVSTGQKIGMIAGSNTASPKVPMAEPLTYVYAPEKSLRGILDGLRRGRTVVASSPDAPTLRFSADILNDGTIDVGLGGFVPLFEATRFVVYVKGGKGKRLDILLNGLPIRKHTIEHDEIYYSFLYEPQAYGVFRARIFDTPTEIGFGPIDMLAMTSPIYANGILGDQEQDIDDMWVRVRLPEATDVPEVELPPDPSATELPVRRLN